MTAAADLLAKAIELRAGQRRSQQEEMVAAVEAAIAAEQHIVVQAGTGTGKSLGYLTAAVASGKRSVVATSTRQLGEQLRDIDLPLVGEALAALGGEQLEFCLLKGRGNYACLARIADWKRLGEQAEAADGAQGLFDAELLDELTASDRRRTPAERAAAGPLLKWADETETGDRTEAPPAVTDRLWREVSIDSSGCPGAQICPFGDRCFAEKARERAREAQLVVTNHALIAQDLLTGGLLGEYEILIVDEAHDLEGSLTDAWGASVDVPSLRGLTAAGLRRAGRAGEARSHSEVIAGQIENLDVALATLDGGLLPELPDTVGDALGGLSDSLAAMAKELQSQAKANSDKQAAGRIQSAALRLAEASIACDKIVNAGTGSVRWFESGRDTIPGRLRAAPLWVGPKFADALGERTLVATSATVTVGGRFEPLLRSLGLADAAADTHPVLTLDVGTPFDFSKQVMLYIPGPGFPEPVGAKRLDHTGAVAAELADLVQAAGGRTLALFTSTGSARSAGAYLREHTEHPILIQGEGPPSVLTREFKEVDESVLCATMGFWQGIDVPGASLSLVVLDKIPFAPADDPVMSARRMAADAAGRNGFMDIYVSSAAILLAQGAGRLIRTPSDRGVVAILDRRLLTKGYGRSLLQGLPATRYWSDKDVILGALKRLASQG